MSNELWFWILFFVFCNPFLAKEKGDARERVKSGRGINKKGKISPF